MNENIGLVIKTVDYLDSVKILTLLTKDGIKSVNVKGGQKPTSHTFSFCHELVLLEYTTKGLYLTSGKIINNYSTILMNSDVLKNTLVILELLNLFSEHINDFNTCFNFTISLLNYLKEGINPYFLSTVFRCKLLYLLGVGPIFNKCIKCGSSLDEESTFSIIDGGMICSNCSHPEDVLTQSKIRPLKLLYTLKLEDSIKYVLEFKKELDNINNLLDIMYSSYLDFTSKTSKVFSKI